MGGGPHGGPREDGEVVGYRGAVQDRTEREREVAPPAELTIRASLLDAVDAAVAATDQRAW